MSHVSVRAVRQEYGPKVVLERLNLEIEDGEFCTILGPSGCGKSTFLRMLLSQERPTHGEILIDGAPIAAEPGPDRGIVFQRYSVFAHMTVLQNVMFAAEMAHAPLLGRTFGRARRKIADEAMAMLDSVELAPAAQLFPKSLSGGMQQRLAIAQALLRQPKILLLDEPFGALDPGTRAAMHVLMKSLWRKFGMTIFMVTHDLSEGFTLGTRLLVFDKVRHDPQAPDAYGATVTYDLPLKDKEDTP